MLKKLVLVGILEMSLLDFPRISLKRKENLIKIMENQYEWENSIMMNFAQNRFLYAMIYLCIQII